ncbi:uncharacterized protein LOC134223054 [Armigeres subalbatus]|uniref:uncharacterized protein LOC134223054 n=1 Tax=Armigeres subalbatus TaxID=124917 RepID=UPI002ED0E603
MVDNLDFANNRFQSLRGKELQKQKWESLGNALNALGGARKTADQWELSWRDLKQKTKTKWLLIQNRQSGENGMVKKKRDVLTELEKTILAIMQKDTLDGDGRTQEGGFNQQTLAVDFDTGDAVPEQPHDAHAEEIEYLEEAYGNVVATGNEIDHMPNDARGNAHVAPVEESDDIEATTPHIMQEAETRPTRTTTPARGRKLGRGQRYSDTGADKKEYRKRKLELHEKKLLIEEKKLVIKHQKVEALYAINETLQVLLNHDGGVICEQRQNCMSEVIEMQGPEETALGNAGDDVVRIGTSSDD